MPHQYSMRIGTIIFLSLAFIAGTIAIIIAAGSHGIYASCGLDGEHDYSMSHHGGHHGGYHGDHHGGGGGGGGKTGPVGETVKRHWSHDDDDESWPDACYGRGESSPGSEDDEYCPAYIHGELFTTLSMWLFVWGLGTVVYAVFMAIAMCVGYKSMGARILEFVGAIAAFFAWIPWGIIGFIFLARHRVDIGGSSGDAVYYMSIVALSIITLVWFLGLTLLTMNNMDWMRSAATHWKAIKGGGTGALTQEAIRAEDELQKLVDEE